MKKFDLFRWNTAELLYIFADDGQNINAKTQLIDKTIYRFIYLLHLKTPIHISTQKVIGLNLYIHCLIPAWFLLVWLYHWCRLCSRVVEGATLPHGYLQQRVGGCEPVRLFRLWPWLLLFLGRGRATHGSVLGRILLHRGGQVTPSEHHRAW